MHQTGAEDLQLAKRAANGDESAFEEIYRAALPDVTRTAAWLLGHSDVDDAVQEAFIRVWNRIGQFRGESRLKTWLTRVAISVILRHRGRRTKRESREGVERVDSHLPDLRASRPLDRVALEAAISSLPLNSRQVFVLSQVEGFSHAEIGSQLGIAEATSRSHLRRARQLLYNQLSSEGPSK